VYYAGTVERQEAMMARVTTKEADDILDIKIKVLDKGFVRLVDYMGGDERVVSAARVSYGRANKTPEEDAILIDYLMAHEHTSPFEQVVMTFHIRLPIFVARQWIRHRTARVNEISGRYTVLPADYYVPDEWRAQDTVNRQGSIHSDALDHHYLDGSYESDCRRSVATYKDLLDNGAAKEMARMNLPLSTYTEWYWQMDLHNLFHFLRLRLDPHAQLEIRKYAEVLYDIAQRVAPVSCAAFKKHVLNTVRIPREEYNRLTGKGE